jgi:enolase
MCKGLNASLRQLKNSRLAPGWRRLLQPMAMATKHIRTVDEILVILIGTRKKQRLVNNNLLTVTIATLSVGSELVGVGAG